MPEENLLDIPDRLSADSAALAEPIACGWHAVNLAMKALRRPLAAARAVVLGGGAIGLGAALVLAARGAADIFIGETNKARHKLLRGAGAFNVYDPISGNGPDAGSAQLVIDAFGGPATRKAASALVRSGGVIVHIGLAGFEGGLDIRRMTLQEVTFIGTYTYTALDFRETLAAIVKGRLGPLDWIETRHLCDGQNAFIDILSGSVAAPKIVLRP